MGGGNSKIAFEICVVTGDFQVSDISPTVFLVAFDSKGEKSTAMTFDNLLRVEENNTIQAKFTIENRDWNSKRIFGQLDHIEFWRVDTGIPIEWYLEKIIVRDRRGGVGGRWEYFFFPVHNWIVAEQHYVVHNCHTFLPKDEIYPELRERELNERQSLFVYTQRHKGLPVELTAPPLDELFSFDTKWDIEETKLSLINRNGITFDYNSDELWPTLSDYNNIYRLYNITEPMSFKRWALDDLAFGAQRLKGCNPIVIKLCTEIPENFAVHMDWLKPHLECWTVRHIIDAKRLYWIDYSILEGLDTKQGRAEMPAPMALFFATESKHLKPLAIQLKQTPDQDSPAFMVGDSPLKWLKAKLWFNMADACYHLIAGRLLNHLILEGVYASMRRNLSQSHPIYQLMAPHFRSFLAVNRRLKDSVFDNEGWILRNTQLSKKGIQQLLKRAFKKWHFDTNANLYRELESRGVYDSNSLSNYPYRDDSLLLQRTFDVYISRVLRHFYPRGRQSLLCDIELQSWRREVASSMSAGGLGLKGVPGGRPNTVEAIPLNKLSSAASAGGVDSESLSNEERRREAELMVSLEEFPDALQSVDCVVKFLGGWLHLAVVLCGAALRQPMFDEYGYVPNYPLNLHGPIPSHLNDEDAADGDQFNDLPRAPESISGRDLYLDMYSSEQLQSIVKCLPSRHSCLDQILSVRIASKIELSRLGQFESDYLFDQRAVEAVLEFRKNLASNSMTIQQRNATLRDPYYQYLALDPTHMANYPAI